MAGGITRGDVRLYLHPSPGKMRPVVVLTRDASIANLASVIVASITSTVRGVPSEVVLTEEDGMKKVCVVNLHNLFTVPQNRIGRRVARLSAVRMSEICRALKFSVGCEPGPV